MIATPSCDEGGYRYQFVRMPADWLKCSICSFPSRAEVDAVVKQAFQNPGFFNEIFLRIFPNGKYLRVLIFGLLGHAAFYEDETRYGVCPYADLRGNLSFIVRVKVK